jgi:hypothetical protein
LPPDELYASPIDGSSPRNDGTAIGTDVENAPELPET